MKEQEAAEKYEGAQEYKQSLKRNITLPRGMSPDLGAKSTY
jgi:hypothetical protein